LNDLRLKTTLEHVANIRVHSVPPHCVVAIQLAHRAGNIRLPRAQRQVKVVGHDAVVPALDIEEDHHVGDHSQKSSVVTIVQEDPHSPIPASHDVTNQIRFNDPPVTSHVDRLTFSLPSEMLGISEHCSKTRAAVLDNCEDTSGRSRQEIQHEPIASVPLSRDRHVKGLTLV
jgi:hypothetical protein